MIDWIRVRKERRIKTIVATAEDVESYIVISKLPDVNAMTLYDLPTHWTIGGVAYDLTRASFIFQILSPEFEAMLPGTVAEEVQKTRHIIEITRKAVSA